MSEKADDPPPNSPNGLPRLMAQPQTQAQTQGPHGGAQERPAISQSVSARDEREDTDANTPSNNKFVTSGKSGSGGLDSADGENNGGPPKKKRRKVNHACVYCRRSHMTCDLERPCARCIKRDIGHLCHDEPREPAKRAKSEPELAPADSKTPENGALDHFHPYDPEGESLTIRPPKSSAARPSMGAPHLGQQKQMSPNQLHKQPNTSQPSTFADWKPSPNTSNQFQDMHTLYPNYSFNTSEITNEYNILGDFLSSSLMDDGALYNEDAQALFNDPLLSTTSMNTYANTNDGASSNSMTLMSGQNSNHTMAPPQIAPLSDITHPSNTIAIDTKAQDKFYMTAADPAGNDTAEERMNKLLRAKYDAGMLKPFNYVKGYARLNKYMELNMRPSSRQKILRQLEKFRPKFREKMQSLTDMQLVFVEMWFERTLMEYDRVFASMAIPACCWRRTGEIYRGNKEMAELINLPIEDLRDGKLALHEIMAEDSLVSYWEKFGAIAFQPNQKAILTSCSIKNPDPTSKDVLLRCCFSFTIRRDTHNIPCLIVGNFLPIQPE